MAEPEDQITRERREHVAAVEREQRAIARQKRQQRIANRLLRSAKNALRRSG